MAKEALAKPGENQGTTTEALKQAATELSALTANKILSVIATPPNIAVHPEFGLLSWKQAIYELAHQACKDQHAYDSNSDGNRTYWMKVVGVHQEVVRTLGKLGNGTPPTVYQHLSDQASWKPEKTNCESDQDCPEDYICVESNCESLFPMD